MRAGGLAPGLDRQAPARLVHCAAKAGSRASPAKSVDMPAPDALKLAA
jgi:hypothetical protein